MTSRSPSSELDLQEILRLRRAAMHQMVDDQVDQLMLELGLQPPQSAPTIGMSFEPSVLFEYVPQDAHEVLAGFYCAREKRTVEVVVSPTAGKIFFEIVDRLGQISTRSMDEELFHQLFQRADEVHAPNPRVRYGLHPIYKSIALRYNADGSISRGRFGEQGEFIADE